MDRLTQTGHRPTNKLHMCATDQIGDQVMVVMDSVLGGGIKESTSLSSTHFSIK